MDIMYAVRDVAHSKFLPFNKRMKKFAIDVTAPVSIMPMAIMAPKRMVINISPNVPPIPSLTMEKVSSTEFP